MAPATADSPIVTYHISPWRLWVTTGVFIALGVVLLVCAAYSTAEPEARNAFTVAALFILACACLLYLVLRFTRLELSGTGIKLYQIGYTLETAWDNVAGLYDVRGAEGLVLHRPMPCRGAAVLRGFRNTSIGGGLRLYNVEQAQLLADRRIIPIEAFAYWLKHGRLRHDLVCRAPSLGT